MSCHGVIRELNEQAQCLACIWLLISVCFLTQKNQTLLGIIIMQNEIELKIFHGNSFWSKKSNFVFQY